MERVGDILDQNLGHTLNLRPEGATVALSRKPWVSDYQTILAQPNVIFHPPTTDGLVEMFGPLDTVDNIRFEEVVYGINSYIDMLATKGDTVGSLRMSISTAVRLAFTSIPFARERAESGAPGPTNFSQTVDHYYSFIHAGVELVIAAGELKNRNLIRRARWAGEEVPGDIETRLGQELRGLANCVTLLGCLLICSQIWREVQDSTDVLLRRESSVNCPIPSGNGRRHTGSKLSC